ncbi:hypothetical protein MOMA_03490 [Moraxella macacae 0408225]|uniref:Uncharacterized protein n=1 Tax=Moraxella macacae 0408225 TaxID=1230338 RepID=L2F8N7_9GAMM|nr:hypothetical protein MOMA_03490 [Moraxella macacae 0408225]
MTNSQNVGIYHLTKPIFRVKTLKILPNIIKIQLILQTNQTKYPTYYFVEKQPHQKHTQTTKSQTPNWHLAFSEIH